MFQLFETISVRHGIAENITYHQQRFEKSYMELWGRIPELQLSDYIRHPEKELHFKARFIYSEKNYDVEYSPYIIRRINSLKLVYCQGADYHLKYLDRAVIDKLYAQRGEADEILIVNDSLITDTSIANIYFFDGKEWLTPRKPLLYGTARARLIKEMDIKQCDISPEQLCDFSRIAVSNAMVGFCELPYLF